MLQSNTDRAPSVLTGAETVDGAVASFKLHKTTEHDAEKPLQRVMPGPPQQGQGLAVSAASSVRGREVRVELLVYLHHLLASESVAGREFGNRFEVVILSTRQGPVEHARRPVADVLEAVHNVARDEDDGAGARRRGLVPDGHLIGALDDEEHFFLAEMDVVGRAFTGFVVCDKDGDGAAGGFGRKQYFQVEAEGLERKRLLGLDDSGLQW